MLALQQLLLLARRLVLLQARQQESGPALPLLPQGVQPLP
jgi:hypothetical protein